MQILQHDYPRPFFFQVIRYKQNLKSICPIIKQIWIEYVPLEWITADTNLRVFAFVFCDLKWFQDAL